MDPLPWLPGPAHITEGCQMQVYVDRDGNLRFFDSAACEVYDRIGPDRVDILVRIAKGIWILGILTDPRARTPVSLPEGYEDDQSLALHTNQGRVLSEPPWGLFRWERISLAAAYESIRWLLPIPRSLIEDIKDRDQPGSDPARKTVVVGKEPKPPTKIKRLRSGDAALKIVAALESLAANAAWNSPESEIIGRAGVPRSTYYKYIKENDVVKKAMEDYHSRRLGRGPVHRNQI